MTGSNPPTVTAVPETPETPETPEATTTDPRRRAVSRLATLFDRPWPAITAAFVVSLGIGLLLVVLTGGGVAETVDVAARATVGSQQGLIDTLVYTTPRLLVAIGVIVALRAGQFNLGAEGQLQLGAIGAALGGAFLAPSLPGPLALPVAVAMAMVCGALWAGIAALMKVLRGCDELISTLLLNFVAVYLVQLLVQGAMKDPDSTFNQSRRVIADAELPRFGFTRLHYGFTIALVCVLLVWLLLERTSLGLRFRSIGHNAVASRYQQLDVGVLTVLAMLISGAICAVAGAGETLGVQFRLIQGFSSGFGFEGLAIAFLAALRPGRALVIALVFGGIFSAATRLQQEVGVTASLAYVVEGLPIVLLACAAGLQALRVKRRGLA
ncbi:ABC transporter permease [Nocardioides caldifontis]|uniref:ABC transporter permease n=1 Tax=Nocardioides caldifontis TaxID=2588938 RepID=UPI0011DFF85C|nr:ABC transporter permease [Nocardioides caldifontis]